MLFPCGFFPLASPEVRSNDLLHSRYRFVFCLCWIKHLSFVFSFPIRLKSPSYLYFFSRRPPLCAENFRFSEVMRQVIKNGAELHTIFVQDDKNSENMFFRDILKIPTVTKQCLYIKISLQEKGDCDHIRTFFIGGKNTAHIALTKNSSKMLDKFFPYANYIFCCQLIFFKLLYFFEK